MGSASPEPQSGKERKHLMQQKLQAPERVAGAEYGKIAGIAVWKDGKPVLERSFGGCTAENRLHVFSVTRSAMSILFGIALDKGLLGSIDRKACDFFPDDTPKRGEKTLRSVSVSDMLMMTAPYKYKSTLIQSMTQSRLGGILA